MYSLECIHLRSFTWVHSLECIYLIAFTWVHSFEYIRLSAFTWMHSLGSIHLSAFTWLHSQAEEDWPPDEHGCDGENDGQCWSRWSGDKEGSGDTRELGPRLYSPCDRGKKWLPKSEEREFRCVFLRKVNLHHKYDVFSVSGEERHWRQPRGFKWVHSNECIHLIAFTWLHSPARIQLSAFTWLHSPECIHLSTWLVLLVSLVQLVWFVWLLVIVK